MPKLNHLAVSVLLGVLSSNAWAITNFTGNFAPEKWAQVTSGDATLSHTSTELVLTNSNTLSGPGINKVFLTLECDTEISFHWAYDLIQEYRVVEYDAGYWVNDVFTQLNTNTGGRNQSGDAVVKGLKAGDLFGFSVSARNNYNKVVQMTVTQFDAVETCDDSHVQTTVPEPMTASLSTMALAGLTLAATRRRR